MKAVKDVSLKQEMSYSCAENVTQLSRARDGLRTVQECRKENQCGLSHKDIRGLKVHSKQIRYLYVLQFITLRLVNYHLT